MSETSTIYGWQTGVGDPITINLIDDPETPPCPCVARHTPVAIELHRHHIWPLGMGGPDEPENIVLLCPTTHSHVHRLIRELVKRQGVIPPYVARRFNPWVVALAHIGYAQAVEAVQS